MYVGKETADDNAKAIARYGPCCVLSAGSRPEILACNQNTAAIDRVVQNKVFFQTTVFVVTPIMEKIVAKAGLVSGLEKTCRYYLVCVHIL